MRSIVKNASTGVGAAVVAVALAACGSGAEGQATAGETAASGGECDWTPEETVTMVVPFDPGGGSDLFGRAVAKGIEEVRPGVDVSVENRPGGSGTIGYTHFYQQAGNPHFLLGAENAMVSLPLEHDELPYDATSWTPLGMMVEDTIFLIARSDSEWVDFDTFLTAAEEAAASGDPLTIAQPAADSIEAMPLNSVLDEEGIEIELVTYDGTAGSIPALLSGDIDGTLANAAEVAPQVKAGQFMPVVASANNELQVEPYKGVPSFNDLGYDPEGAFAQFRGVIAPPELSACAQEYWVEALKDWTETDAYAKYVDSNVVAPHQIWGAEWLDYLAGVEQGYKEFHAKAAE